MTFYYHLHCNDLVRNGECLETMDVLTLKKTPNSEDQEGDEGVVGKVLHGGDHHTGGA